MLNLNPDPRTQALAGRARPRLSIVEDNQVHEDSRPGAKRLAWTRRGTAEALVYQLWPGCPDLRPLGVLGELRLAIAPSIEATLCILAASHAATITVDGAPLATELLAAVEVDPSSTLAPLGQFDAARTSPAHCFSCGNTRLRTAVRVVEDTPGRRRFIARLLSDPLLRGRVLAYEYDGEGAPMAAVYAARGAHALGSCHTYPKEGRIVFSETAVDLLDGYY